jgi:Mlc titration factor MtfA (ptsG expression regulator)
MTPLPALIILSVSAIIIILLNKNQKKKIELPDGYKDLLAKHVAFYRSIDEAGKRRFEEKIKEFLSYVSIHGVNTTVDDLDRLLIASSAVIPIFAFPEWRYYNLRDILLYPGSFNEADFSTDSNANVLGMVGTGAMQMIMILSKPDLHKGFNHISGKENTGIHEFVHLLDKGDGAVDGLPEALLDKQYIVPWLRVMAENIAAIRKGKSDINVYGSKNEAEFFAVASEYFFGQPELFKEKHPELYELMTHIFQRHSSGK